MIPRSKYDRHGRLVCLTHSRCLSFNRALGYLQRVSGPQILRESRRRIEDTTEPQKKKKDVKHFFCFRTKTAHIEQLLFDPIGPFSYVLSQLLYLTVPGKRAHVAHFFKIELLLT